jgi:mannosyltransferase OCH1-like enzyme
MLLIALRQGGRLERSTATPSAEVMSIPRRIAQFWHTQSVPPDVAHTTQSWLDSHPGFECRLFSDQTAAAYLDTAYGAEVRQAFERSADPVQRANIFRLAFLAQEGGFYADIDNVCLAPVQTFVPPEADLVVAQEEYGALSNSFIGAVPQHPVIVMALRTAVEEVNRGDHDMVWLSTGPGLLTRAFGRVLSGLDDGMGVLERSIVFRQAPLQRYVAFAYPLAYKRRSRFRLPRKPLPPAPVDCFTGRQRAAI